MNFPADDIRLKKIYGDDTCDRTDCSKIKEVYGDFSFPELPADRTFTVGSFVQSLDGKIAFPDSPDGTLVAKGNTADPQGALADYWILNMLRTVCDGVLMGSSMIAREPDLTGRVYDPELSSWRKENGKTPVPIHVLVSGKGSTIPADHKILTSEDIPVLIITTSEGKKNLEKRLGDKFEYCENTRDLKAEYIGKSLVSLGEGERLDVPEVLKVLKMIGIDTMLIESPTFLSNLMNHGILDELFLNTSSVFIGGKALSIGTNSDSFTFEKHPLGKVVSIHSHSDYFFYTRYRMEY